MYISLLRRMMATPAVWRKWIFVISVMSFASIMYSAMLTSGRKRFPATGLGSNAYLYPSYTSESESDVIQRKRQAWLNEACDELMVDGSTYRGSPEIFNHILVDDKHKVLYCYVPKAGSSTWRKLLLDAYNDREVPLTSVHSEKLRARLGIRSLRSYRPDEIAYRLITYFKFIFVRHPLTRLLSAFREKFEGGELTKLHHAYVLMIRKVLRQAGKSEKESKRPVTFDDFLRYVFFEKELQKEEHWATAESMCSPCRIKYNFIGTMETFTKDSDYILSNYVITNITLPHHGVITKTDDQLAMKYYSKLPKELLAKIVEHYIRDAKIFHYKMPQTGRTTTNNSP